MDLLVKIFSRFSSISKDLLRNTKSSQLMMSLCYFTTTDTLKQENVQLYHLSLRDGLGKSLKNINLSLKTDKSKKLKRFISSTIKLKRESRNNKKSMSLKSSKKKKNDFFFSFQFQQIFSFASIN